MRSTALICAAIIAYASAQEEINLLRGDRFLSAIPKAEKSMSVQAQVKSPKRERQLDEKSMSVAKAAKVLTVSVADAKAEKISSVKVKAEKITSTKVFKESASSVSTKAAKVLVESESSSAKAAKAVDTKAAKASSVGTKAAKLFVETAPSESVSTKAAKESSMSL